MRWFLWSYPWSFCLPICFPTTLNISLKVRKIHWLRLLNLSVHCTLHCSVSVLHFFLLGGQLQAGISPTPRLTALWNVSLSCSNFCKLQHFLIHLGSEAQSFYVHFSPICGFSRWLKMSISHFIIIICLRTFFSLLLSWPLPILS